MTDSAVTLEVSDIGAFRDFSHDRNPLHTDPDYARRTPFGECVAYGALGAWAAIGGVADSRPIRLRSFKCSFFAPLHVGLAYDRSVEQTGEGQARITLQRGGAKKLELRLGYEESPGAHPVGTTPSWDPLQQPEAPEPEELKGRTLEGFYAVDTSRLGDLSTSLGVPSGHVPLDQLQCLAWVSYLCGMHIPGRQSLILSIRLDFEPVEQAPGSLLRYRAQVERYDARYRHLRIAVTLSNGSAEICRGMVEAFSRPNPVAFRIEETREVVGASGDLAGKVALVTGGSRGLGAHLAAALALHGCRVAINYHRSESEAAVVAAAIRESGGEAILVQGDVADSATCSRMREQVESRFGRLDLLINNASPPILPYGFMELTAAGITDFVNRSLQAFVQPTQAFLPLLKESGGCVVTISSSYVEEPLGRFGHYVAAKAAVEGLTRVLAKENDSVRCLVLRPSRLHTDQTNVNIDLQKRRSPAEVATELIQEIQSPSTGSNYAIRSV